ncbi:MAG: hypothetical protein KF760_11220 [Candidatus Eremiobacteraeota bacterium]|nr:hypothetical protein [Candidatus Eremiobacteraeota bacterium]MCW5870628.1 hypothetical protein [Candidatus Eremiobacteraeota bacterium]
MGIKPNLFSAFQMPQQTFRTQRGNAAMVTFVMPVEAEKKVSRAVSDKPDQSMEVLSLMGNHARIALKL